MLRFNVKPLSHRTSVERQRSSPRTKWGQTRRCRSGAPLKPALLQHWSSGSERKRALVPQRSLHINAQPKFITAMDRCFNARHHSSNSVSAHKTLTNAPPKFAQHLTTAGKKQRWSNVHDFCVGLADQSVHELATSGAKLWLSGVIAAVNLPERKMALYDRSQYFVQLKTVGAVGGTINGDRAYTAFL